ncbi:MAG: hypothetical protein MHPSP_001073 [Paramarteilia canceri]
MTTLQEEEDRKKRTLYVGGIPEEYKESDVTNAFIPFGFIESIKMPMDYQQSKHRGFAFVEFEEADDASEALFNMNDAELSGSQIKVNFALPDKAKDYSKPGIVCTFEFNCFSLGD